MTLLFILLTGCDYISPAPTLDFSFYTLTPAPYLETRRPNSATPGGPTLPPPAVTTAPAATAASAATAAPAATATTLAPGQASVQPGGLRIWLSPALPAAFMKDVQLPSAWEKTSTHNSANLWLEIPSQWAYTSSGGSGTAIQSHWIFAVVAPFPTVQDQVKLEDIHQSWAGNLSAVPGHKPILMTAETKALLDLAWGDSRVWGPASSQGIQIVEPGEIIDTAWKNQPSWAIIPFEEIEPRWKVLKVDGQSPLANDFDPRGGYPLSFPIWLQGTPEALAAVPASLGLPTNRDPHKLTSVVLTGVTALSRHIGEKMESEGLTYPGRDVRDWLVNADITHISNEVSFYSECPKPGPLRADMRFCSNPKYIELLEYVGTDIVEQTGNHMLDWGYQPMLDTLQMYAKRGWKWYGGGANLQDALKPLLMEHNGNKLAFLGCSPAGPEQVWATSYSPGSAPCNLYKLEQQIGELRAQGYLPIFTFQHHETDGYLPSPAGGAPDFRRMAQAGAVIVSGSQSHYAQTMTLVKNASGQVSFVHYGLGNLFFDQMEPPEIRNEFIDRHIFYNGKYLGVELLTAELEDSARPHPMTPADREYFLKTIFALSDWSGN